VQFVERCSYLVLETGDLDGLVLTGLGEKGLELIQSYVDRTADVQTASLLACYASAIGVAESAVNDDRCARWIASYQQLLNTWKLWSQRAKLDVSRALLNARTDLWLAGLTLPGTASHSSSLAAINAMQRAGAAQLAAGQVAALAAVANSTKSLDSVSARVLAAQVAAARHRTSSSVNLGTLAGLVEKAGAAGAGGLGGKGIGVKPQVYARCNFCNAPLSVDSSQSGAKKGPTSFRQRQPIRAPSKTPSSMARSRGCPSCRKSLQRCALCLVPLDCAAPKLASSATMQRIGARAEDEEGGEFGEAKTKKKETGDARFDHSSPFSFSQWWTWCQNCRHGGHEEHMGDWFSSHQVCPVTDCNCRCLSADLVYGAAAAPPLPLAAPAPAPAEPPPQPSPGAVNSKATGALHAQLLHSRAASSSNLHMRNLAE